MTQAHGLGLQIEGEVAGVKEEVRHTRDRAPAAQQRSSYSYRQTDSRMQKPLRAPIPSLPSNTADVMRKRGDYRAAKQSQEDVRSSSPARYGPIIPSLRSNTEEVLAARASSRARSAADNKSSAELARFCDGLLLSRKR